MTRFRLTEDELIDSAKNNIRILHTLDFIGNHKTAKSLDVGERNPITPLLEKQLQTKIENTSIDLDTEKLEGNFDTVFCFEVVEHLMNPLHLLLEIRSCLTSNGTLFLSTPLHKPHFLWDKHHFTELDFGRLKTLVTRAGFTITKSKIVRSRPLWWYFRGFRPLLRLFFNRTIILELKISHK
ncbi:methyltransferase domain-containing protein [bacterium]|nr:methyltransferase domain-containing protein [bacterium]